MRVSMFLFERDYFEIKHSMKFNENCRDITIT